MIIMVYLWHQLDMELQQADLPTTTQTTVQTSTPETLNIPTKTQTTTQTTYETTPISLPTTAHKLHTLLL